MKVSITVSQGLPINRMGLTSVPFRINLGQSGFDRFLNEVPMGARDFYEERAQGFGKPEVEVVVPEALAHGLGADEPTKAIKRLYEASIQNRLYATADTLRSVAKVVGL